MCACYCRLQFADYINSQLFICDSFNFLNEWTISSPFLYYKTKVSNARVEFILLSSHSLVSALSCYPYDIRRISSGLTYKILNIQV